MKTQKTKGDLIKRALDIRKELSDYGFHRYTPLFRLYFPKRYGDKKMQQRLGAFFSGQINDPFMLAEAEELLKFIEQTSSKRKAA